MDYFKYLRKRYGGNTKELANDINLIRSVTGKPPISTLTIAMWCVGPDNSGLPPEPQNLADIL